MTTPTLEHARPEDIGLSPQRLDKLGEVFRDEIARARAPGAVVLVSRRGKVGYFESFGRRDPAAQDVMAKDAIFRIYSMTKPIVSVAVMMLVEDGHLLLTDPVSKEALIK